MQYFIIFLITLLMALAGCYFGLTVAVDAEGGKRRKDNVWNLRKDRRAAKRAKRKVAKEAKKAVKKTKAEQRAETGGHLSKADQKKASYTDFCCEMDDDDPLTRIKGKMRGQDENYHKIKKDKKKK